MPFRCRWTFPREEKCLLDLPWSVLQIHPTSPFLQFFFDIGSCDLFASSESLLISASWVARISLESLVPSFPSPLSLVVMPFLFLFSQNIVSLWLFWSLLVMELHGGNFWIASYARSLSLNTLWTFVAFLFITEFWWITTVLIMLDFFLFLTCVSILPGSPLLFFSSNSGGLSSGPWTC
jgi:hypothetical protein